MTCPICVTVWMDSLPHPNNVYDVHYMHKCRCCGYTISPDKPITTDKPIPEDFEDEDDE